MQKLTYYWINVFTTQQDKGTPLPVFILDTPLSTNAMQKIATMMNQAETVFIEDAKKMQPILHIFTPMQVLPFAGHPVIGALEILDIVRNNAPFTSIQCMAGTVSTQIDHESEIYWIKAPQAPISRKSELDYDTTANMLGVVRDQIVSLPIWVNTGSEQLIVELKDPHAIDSIIIDLPLFKQYASLYAGRTIIYAWAKNASNEIYARYFYLKEGLLGEDSGTGSAAANLGGYQVLNNQNDFSWKITQGRLIQKESILYLQVQKDQSIWIGGQNRYLGKGELYWKD